MRTYLIFREYIPIFDFSKPNFLIFAGRTSAALECKSENDQLINMNKQRFFFSGVTTYFPIISVSHVKINNYQTQSLMKSFLLHLTSSGLDLKLKIEISIEVFLIRNFWTRIYSVNT